MSPVRSARLAAGLAVAIGAGLARGASSPPPDAKIAPWLAARLASERDVPFLVLFDAPETLDRVRAEAGFPRERSRSVYDALRLRARSRQQALRRWLDARRIPYRTLYIVDGLAVRGDAALARAIASRDDVVRLVGDPVVRGLDADLLVPAAAGTDSGVEWGVAKINADDVWGLDGARGEGVVVASADTGVEWTHPAIQAKYRGWNGSAADHDFNWFDAIADTLAPIDDYDHGTHTTGTMVGDDGAGDQVGVAPGARWIACRNMDAGFGQPSTYLACNQFFLAPYPHGGDPELDGDPSKAPDIVNNSWGCPPSEGCDPGVLRNSFAALSDAGILAVASAGNGGPSCATVTDPPGIYGEALVAGASDINDGLASFSSKGPVNVDGSGRLRPDLTAPGVSVRSSVRGGGYATFSGTSMASPHVAGAAALLWSAKPQVRGLVRITRCLLTQSARSVIGQSFLQSCGGTGPSTRPNNLWGAGLVDAYGAIHLGPDPDGDGIASACDCAAGDPGAYDAPPEVEGLAFAADKAAISWRGLSREAGNGTVYDAIRGDLAALRAGGSIDGAGCLASPTTATSVSDPSTPAGGAGFYYLVQARNTCGKGGWGTSSSGAARAHANCP